MQPLFLAGAKQYSKVSNSHSDDANAGGRHSYIFLRAVCQMCVDHWLKSSDKQCHCGQDHCRKTAKPAFRLHAVREPILRCKLATQCFMVEHEENIREMSMGRVSVACFEQ